MRCDAEALGTRWLNIEIEACEKGLRVGGKPRKDDVVEAEIGCLLLQRRPFTPFACNLQFEIDLQRAQRGRGEEQRVIAFDPMKTPETPDPEAAALRPRRGATRGATPVFSGPRRTRWRHAEPLDSEIRNRIGIRHPQGGESVRSTQQAAIGRFQIGGMLPADDGQMQPLARQLSEQRGPGQRSPQQSRAIVAKPCQQPSERREMIAFGPIANVDGNVRVLQGRNTPSVPATERKYPHLRAAFPENVDDRGDGGRSASAFHRVNDIGDAQRRRGGR
mgnify:CR=1 FL=1